MNNKYGYITHRQEDRDQMLVSMGLESMADLYGHIPQALRLKRALNLPEAYSEWALERHMRDLASKNRDFHNMTSFLGGGMYEHHVPAVVDALAERGEFLTAYTPYQPEMSQGLLQVLAEYQQYMSAIIGLPVVNSSSYDGATAMADAIWMGCQANWSTGATIAWSPSIWPQCRQVVATYMTGRQVDLADVTIDSQTGLIDLHALEAHFAEYNPTVFAFQTPNCFGLLENVEAIATLCQRYGVTSVLHYHPFLSGLFVPPGELGVDIVCGEGQMLGIPLSSGGPSIGFLASRRELCQYIPGRLVGTVADIYGNPAYALVHEEREQHVARERATSNICSNQANCALRVSIYLSTLGSNGLRDIAAINTSNAHYFASALANIPGISLTFASDFFNEFLISLPFTADLVLHGLREHGIYGGVNYAPLGMEKSLLVAVTETKSQSQLDEAVTAFRQVLTDLAQDMAKK